MRRRSLRAPPKAKTSRCGSSILRPKMTGTRSASVSGPNPACLEDGETTRLLVGDELVRARAETHERQVVAGQNENVLGRSARFCDRRSSRPSRRPRGQPKLRFQEAIIPLALPHEHFFRTRPRRRRAGRLWRGSFKSDSQRETIGRGRPRPDAVQGRDKQYVMVSNANRNRLPMAHNFARTRVDFAVERMDFVAEVSPAQKGADAGSVRGWS